MYIWVYTYIRDKEEHKPKTKGVNKMTNAQIIFAAEQNLAANGIIRYTGRTMEGTDGNGNKVVMMETEEIHTFKKWNELGYTVRKGETAIAKIKIWKHTGKRLEEIETSEGTKKYVDQGRMFMKTAAFFSASQVVALA